MSAPLASAATTSASLRAVPPDIRARWAAEIAKYPDAGKASAVIACLAIVQDRLGYISQDTETQVAELLGMPPIAVHEVTTFYNMFNQRPVGRYKLNVCTNLPCQLRDGQTALEHVCGRLGIAPGDTTADGIFTVQQAECLGACADAPVLLVNDRQMCSYMTAERLDELIVELRAQHLQTPSEHAQNAPTPPKEQ